MRRTGSVNRRQSTIAWEGCSGQKRRGQQNKTQHEANKRLNNQKKLAKSSNKASALSHTLLNLTGQADFHRKPASFLMEAINQGEEDEEEEGQ